MVQYPWPLEIMYGQGGKLLGHKLKNSLIEDEYGINTSPASSGNLQAKTIIERIHQVLGNLVHTYNIQEPYVYDTDPCMGILAAAAFMVRPSYHRTKDKVQAS